jgi:hypothetical protein
VRPPVIDASEARYAAGHEEPWVMAYPINEWFSERMGVPRYGISGDDPITLALAILVLGAVAVLACLFPALAAVRINPITALRE